MTTDLRALRRDELAAKLSDLAVDGLFPPEGGVGDGYALVREVQRRLREDGARIAALERQVLDLRDAISAESTSVDESIRLAYWTRRRVGELEVAVDLAKSQACDLREQLAEHRLAANSKGDAPKLIDAWYVTADSLDSVAYDMTRGSYDQGLARGEAQGLRKCAEDLRNRLPPEPAKRDFDPFAPIDQLPADIQRDIATERGLAPGPVKPADVTNVAPLDENVLREKLAEGRALRKHYEKHGWDGLRGATAWVVEPAKPVEPVADSKPAATRRALAPNYEDGSAARAVAHELDRVLAGVERVAKYCDDLGTNASRMWAHEVAAKLRGLM